MAGRFCIASDHAKLKFSLTDIMSVQQQTVITGPGYIRTVYVRFSPIYVHVHVYAVCTVHALRNLLKSTFESTTDVDVGQIHVRTYMYVALLPRL